MTFLIITLLKITVYSYVPLAVILITCFFKTKRKDIQRITVFLLGLITLLFILLVKASFSHVSSWYRVLY